MKLSLFKILLVALPCMVWPGQTEAEMLRAVKTEHQMTLESLDKTNELEAAQWRKQKIEKRKGIFRKARKAESKGGTILKIVLLSIGMIFFGGVGLLWLSALGFFGSGILLFVIPCLILGVLCLIGLIKQIQKLGRANQGEMPAEVPRRPPTKKTNGLLKQRR